MTGEQPMASGKAIALAASLSASCGLFAEPRTIRLRPQQVVSSSVAVDGHTAIPRGTLLRGIQREAAPFDPLQGRTALTRIASDRQHRLVTGATSGVPSVNWTRRNTYQAGRSGRGALAGSAAGCVQAVDLSGAPAALCSAVFTQNPGRPQMRSGRNRFRLGDAVLRLSAKETRETSFQEY